MNKIYRFVLLSSVLALMGLNGCDSDAGAEKPDSQNPCTDACTPDEMKCDGNAVYVCEKSEDTGDACYEWSLKEKCANGKSCDKTKFECVAAECSDTCDEEDLYRCSLKGLLQCTPDANGCASWVVVDSCEGKTCDPDTLECVDEVFELCPNACDPDKESKKCDGVDVYVCQKNDAIEGCYTWVHDATCDNGQHCDETTFECVEGCTEVCEESHSTRCSSDGLEQCKPDEKGCASWSVVDACEGGACDAESLKCVKACDNQCADGEKKCEANGIVTCIKDADGCLGWGDVVACGENKTCDSEKMECSDVCRPNCDEINKKETHAASQKVCTDVDGKGCLQWVETKCKKGEKFDAGQNKCVSVCGDDCEMFSIIFLPDTQYYTRKLKKDSKGNVVKDGRDIFSDQIKWILDSKDKYNIKAVIHLGDVTDTNALLAWQFADSVYTKLDASKIPYTVAPGNHDFKQCEYAASQIKNKEANEMAVGKCSGKNGSTYKRSATNFHKEKGGNFNQNRPKVSKYDWFAEYKADKTVKAGNSFITFKAANIDFLVVALEYAPRKSVVEWASDVISKHPNHKVIVETHAYLNPNKYDHCKSMPKMNDKGQYTTDSETKAYSDISEDARKGFENDVNSGEDLFNKLVAKHNNIILVVNGHHTGSCFRLNKGNNGNTVAEMVVDYQSENGTDGLCGEKKHENGGAGMGWFKMLKFDPKNYTITSVTTSSLGGTKFKKGKEWFYCSDYPHDPKEKPMDKDGKEYRINIENNEQRFTNKHAFVADFDFVTPIDYIKP